MQVQLKNNVFTATQWFKDGDHPMVEKVEGVESRYIGTVRMEAGDYNFEEVIPGMWIVEFFDGIHLYSDEEFRELFIEYKPQDNDRLIRGIYEHTRPVLGLPGDVR